MYKMEERDEELLEEKFYKTVVRSYEDKLIERDLPVNLPEYKLNEASLNIIASWRKDNE